MSLTFLLLSFIAGFLTVLAPCILPLLPIVVGGSISETRKSKPYIITASLVISVLIFTILLKVLTNQFGISAQVWKSISGGVIILLGLFLLFPGIWARFVSKIGFETRSQKNLAKASSFGGVWGDILTGAALGPVFTSCSPTYGVIVITVFAENFIVGFINLLAYILGLAIVLLLIALIGQKFVSKLGIIANPRGKFMRTIAILFILVGFAVVTGFDKTIEVFLIENGLYFIGDFESDILQSLGM